jgi:hypothetical protein
MAEEVKGSEMGEDFLKGEAFFHNEETSQLSTGSRLCARFDEKDVKQRSIHRHGKELVLDYIPGHKVIERLNQVFDYKWSFQVVEKIINSEIGHISVLGRLTVQQEGFTVIKEQWGGCVVAAYRDTGSPIALFDDLKIASTDALKKCATLLGIALYLYEQDDVTEDVKVQPPKPAQEKVDEKRKAVNKKAALPEVDKPCTSQQLDALKNLLDYEAINVDDFLAGLGVKNMVEIGYNDMSLILTRKHNIWTKKA